MKKRIFGIKIGSIFSVFLCLIAAILFWLFVKYMESGSSTLQALNMFTLILRG